MKRPTIVLTFLVLMSQSVLAQIDINRCVEMAYDNYPQIVEYDLIEASRKYDLNNAALAWAPQLSISGKASWQSDVVEMPFEFPGFEFNIPHDQYGVTADLNQQIWDGGASAVNRRLVEAGSEVKRRQLDVNLYSIRSRVQNLYLSVVLIDRQIELNGILSDNLERNLKEVEVLVDNGVAYESDKNQIRVNILSCEQQRASLETEKRAYVRMLGILTGSDLQDAKFEEPAVNSDSYDGLDISRPELALYDAQEKQIAVQKEQLVANISPKLNLSVQAGYGRPGLNMLSGEFDPYLQAGLRLQWNFGSLYTLHNDRMKSEAEARKVSIAKDAFLMNTSVEALQKLSEIEKASDVLSRDPEIISLAQDIRETAESQYKEGIIKMNDYLGMLDNEFEARLNHQVHRIQYIMAVLDLENTLGVDNK